jgi:hypothetical protein
MSNFRETTNKFFRSAFSEKASLTAAPTLATTIPTCLGGFEPPPPTLAQMILTALPVSVLTDLGNAHSRSSLASQFKAGNTPDWYINLAPAVKSYVESVQTHATTGCSITPTRLTSGQRARPMLRMLVLENPQREEMRWLHRLPKRWPLGPRQP